MNNNISYYKEEEIKEYFKTSLKDIYDYDGLNYIKELIADGTLHHEIFNTDYYMIGHNNCNEWLRDKAFEIIGFVQEYEMDNFGESCTDLTSAESVLNMYVYIIWEKLVADFESISTIKQSIYIGV